MQVVCGRVGVGVGGCGKAACRESGRVPARVVTRARKVVGR